MNDDAVVYGATKKTKKKKVESREKMKLPENFHRQIEENRPISLFPNPNTIKNFMMAIDNHMRSFLVRPCRRRVVSGALQQDSNKNDVTE